MTLWLKATSGSFGTWPYNLSKNPCPTIQAVGLGGRQIQQHYLEIEMGNMKQDKNKPPYTVPTMEEIRNIKPSGFKVASTFSGAGGSCTGYRMAGFEVVWANEFVPAAQESYKANASASCYLDKRDIRQVKPEDILEQIGIKQGELDLFDGSPPCFPSGTKITTLQGEMPIDFLTVNMLVLTHNNQYKRVIQMHNSQYNNKIFQIDLKYGRDSIETTYNHPFFARKRITKKRDCKNRKNGSEYKTYSEPQWVESQDLSIGDVLLDPHIKEKIGLEIPKIITKQRINIEGQSGKDFAEYKLLERECNIDWKHPEMAFILGFYLAEGHSRGVNPILTENKPCRREAIFSVADKEALWFAEKLKKQNLNSYVQKHSKGSSRVTVSSIDFWSLCSVVGKYADKKFIPAAFHTMPLKWQKEFIDGYYTGDGCFTRNGKVQIRKATTVSRDIVQGMVKMIAKVYSVVPSISILYPAGMSTIEGRIVNVKEAYGINFSPAENSERVRPGFVDDHGSWIPIKKVTIKDTETPITVYNLEVDQDNSYVANGAAVHNCQAFSTAGKREKGWGKGKKYEHGVVQCNEQLFFDYIRILRGLKPKVFVAENVSGMLKGTAKGMFLEILKELKESGYKVKCKLLDAQWLGVPQMRQRAIFIGVREDLGIDPVYPLPLKYRYSVQDALSDIISIQYGDPSHHKNKNCNFERGEVDKSEHNVSRTVKTCGLGGTSTHFAQTKQGEKRKFTIPELKKICAFPDDFILIGTYAQQWERLGNSVPPVMMQHIAKTIEKEILCKL